MAPGLGAARPGVGTPTVRIQPVNLQVNHLAMEVADVETLFKAREFLKQQGMR